MGNSASSGNILGYASGTQPGLVSTTAQTFAGKKTLDGGALIKGDTSGSAIAAGYVGERLYGQGSNTGLGSGSQTVYLGTPVTLTAGVWIVQTVGIGSVVAPTAVSSGVANSSNVAISDSDGLDWAISNSDAGNTTNIMSTSSGLYYFRLNSSLAIKAFSTCVFGGAGGTITVKLQAIRIA